ncbi:conserved Plasmodium protein, unknown function [Plasmodium gallinaceum]|uniref:Uncharacterized protein n=1 Tax=Plasmodium gallinaceum TaxID=5849 RepID=A0A1J1GRB9_PLAGA|nr:conserved Plasmodium protein, unknown function [Plasmodium gallinaceum]CRG94842.1 conserved Plasmodium protein, unknown function [Plasmodium gallinaceum]
MELRKNKKNKLYSNDDQLKKKLQENNKEYDSLKNLLVYNESEGNKYSDSNSNIISNTYENIYEDFSSNYDDSSYKSNDDLTEFYLYNEISNHKYNNNLYDFYLSKFNSNIEEKNKLNESNLSFINQIPYIIKKESYNKSERNKSKNVKKFEKKEYEKSKEMCHVKDSYEDIYNYDNKENENKENENLSELKKKDNISCNSLKINENIVMKKENVKKGDAEKNDKLEIEEKANIDNVYFNTLINKCNYTVSCYMYKKTNATHIYRKKILVLKKNFLIINKFKHNINNMHKGIHRDIYDISYSRYSKIYKNSNNIYKFSLYARRLSKNNTSSNSDNSNFFSLKKKKKKKKNNYKISKDEYNFNNEQIRLANHNLNIILELINLMKIVSIYGSLKKYIKVVIYKYTKNLFLKNYEIYCNTPKYFILLKKFYNSINRSVYNYIYVNILKIKNIEQLKYNYIYAIIDVDNFLYYYKYEYNKDMFIPLFSDRQNKISFNFYTDYNLYLGYFIIYSYEIEKHINFNLNRSIELNLNNYQNDSFLLKKEKKNASTHSTTSSNKTESLFDSFDKSDFNFNGSSLLNQKNIIFDKNYFFVRKLYNDQKKHIQKNSKYISNSNDNINIHLFIYKSKNRFEYLLPSINTTDLLCDEDNLYISSNNINNNYQLINLFLNNIKRTMQIKNKFNYFLEKINNILEFKNFLVSVISIFYIFFCSYYKNYIHIIILLTILFILLINNDKNYDFYKNLLYEFPILYLFFPYKLLYKISKKSDLYHLHTFLHIFLLNKFPTFFQYLYKYYKYKCIYFFVYSPSYFNKYYNNYFFFKTNNDIDKMKLSAGRMSKIKNKKKKSNSEIFNHKLTEENTIDSKKKINSMNNLIKLSSNFYINNHYVNIHCKTNGYNSKYENCYNLNKQNEINKDKSNENEIDNKRDEQNKTNKNESCQNKIINDYKSDKKNISNMNSALSENDNGNNINKKNNNQNKNNKNEENINDKILNNLRRYFKNKSLNNIYTKGKILRGIIETGNNDINSMSDVEKKKNIENVNSLYEEHINDKHLKNNKVTHIIKNDKKDKIESFNLNKKKNSEFRNILNNSYEFNDYRRINECRLKKSYSEIKNGPYLDKKKDERDIFSDIDPKNYISNNLHSQDLLSNNKNYENHKNSYIENYNKFNKEIVSYSNTLLDNDSNINEIILMDLKVKIINNMKNNYYDSKNEEKLEKIQEENITDKKYDESRMNNKFSFNINNEYYSFDYSLYENQYTHYCKSYNHSFSSGNYSCKDIKSKQKNNIYRSYISNNEVYNNNESSFYRINEYFPNYFYSSIEMIYINIILIFIYLYCFFIITVHGGLNNDFPLYFYFLNKKKKKEKKTKHKEKKNNSSEQNDKNFKMYTKKKSDEKKYKSNFLFKSKHIFKSWKQKRKLNKKNIKISLNKKEYYDSNDNRKKDYNENDDSLFNEKKNENNKIVRNYSLVKDELSNISIDDNKNLINYNLVKEKELINENDNEKINIRNKNFFQKENSVYKNNIIYNNRKNDNYSSIYTFNKKCYSTELRNSYDKNIVLNKDKFLDHKLVLQKNNSMDTLQNNYKQDIEINNNCSNDSNFINKDEEEINSSKFIYMKKKQYSNENDEKKKKHFKFLEKLKDIKEEKITKIKNIYNSEKKNKRFKKGFNLLKKRISNDSIFENFNKSKDTLDENEDEDEDVNENVNENENVKKDVMIKEKINDKYIKKNDKIYDNSVNTINVNDKNNQMNIRQKIIDINKNIQNGIESIWSLKNDYNKNNTNHIKNENFLKDNYNCSNYISRTSTYKEGNVEITKSNEINLNGNNSKNSEMGYIYSNMNSDVSLINDKKLNNASFSSKRKKIKNKIISYMKNKSNKDQKNKSCETLLNSNSLSSLLKGKIHLKNDKEIINLKEDNEVCNLKDNKKAVNLEEDKVITYVKDTNEIININCDNEIISIQNNNKVVSSKNDNKLNFLKNDDELINVKNKDDIINLRINKINSLKKYNEVLNLKDDKKIINLLTYKRRNYTISSNMPYEIKNTIIRRNYIYHKCYKGYFSEYDENRIIKNKGDNKYIYSKMIHKSLEMVKHKCIEGEDKHKSKINDIRAIKNRNEYKYEVFNKYITSRKNSKENYKINLEEKNGTEKNYISKKKKKIFLHMKETFMKLKNKNKKNLFKEKADKISHKQNSIINNDYEEKKRNTANRYNLFLNDFIDEKSINRFKKRMLFMSALEKNNTDKLYYSLDEYDYCNNNLKCKISTEKKKEYDIHDEHFDNVNNKLNKKNITKNIYELNNNMYKNKEFYDEVDKKNISSLFKINEDINNLNKSQILKNYKSNKILNSNSNNNFKNELMKNLSQNVFKKKKKREKHIITTMVNNFYKFLLNKKKDYKCLKKKNIFNKIYYNLLIAIIDYLLIIIIAYKYVNNIYNIFIYSKHLHLKTKKKENKRNLDFNHIVRIIYHKNVFLSNSYTLNIYKHKNIYLKKNIFKQIFVQNKKQNIKINEKYDEEEVSSGSKQNEQAEIKSSFVPNKYYEEIKNRKNILSLYKSAKSNIKIFMSKHMFLNHYLEKFLNLFNHKNFNLTKIVIVLLGYFSLLLFPIKFHHLVILKILHMYYKGFLRRYHKNIILNSILEKIKNIKTFLKLNKPICSLSEEEYYALIEEINKTCNQCLNISQFKDINDEYDLAYIIMKNFREFSEIKKIIRHEWNFNLLNNSPHDNTNIF